MMDNTPSLRHKIPTHPHPAVKAFTNALSTTLRGISAKTSTKAGKKNSNGNKKVTSDLVEKVSQTLGWRNRHSQSEFYPIEIQYKTETTESSDSYKNDTDNASANEMCTKMTTTILQIKQVQRGEIENTYGTGATVWPASIVLVKYLEHILVMKQNGGRFDMNYGRKITVADLGSGTGVTSIATAFYLGMNHGNGSNQKTGSFIVCTDGSDSVVQLAKENIEKTMQNFSSDQNRCKHVKLAKNTKESNRSEFYNIGQSQIKVRKYMWGDGTLLQELKTVNNKQDCFFDIVLVSDCVLPRLYPIKPLVDAIDELSGPNTVTYVSYEYRYYPEYDPKEFFVRAAEVKGLEVKTVPLSEQHPVYSVDDIEIWEVRRQKAKSDVM